MASDEANPLLSTQKSDSDLQVILHPLVLLTVSDYITRHTLREHSGPVVGAILGRQDGREITMEHAFECPAATTENGESVLNPEWFACRLEQMKLVHKDRGLDLVGWYTLLPRTGPTPRTMAIHDYILLYNESAALLAFHPEEATADSASGKLPLTIYETVYESDESSRGTASRDAGGEDKEMKDGGPAGDEVPKSSAPHLSRRFRELPYSVETSEAEMISMDYVVRGGANATAARQQQQQQQDDATSVASGKKKATLPSPTRVDIKGKRRAVVRQEDEADEASDGGAAASLEPAALSREDEEMIAALTAKANAIKMLHSRIQLIIKYLESLPPEEEQQQQQQQQPAGGDAASAVPRNKTILRSIQALVNRIPLLTPSSAEAFQTELLSESNNVHLISLLNDVIQSVVELRDIGRKFLVVDNPRDRRHGHGGGGGGSGGGSGGLPLPSSSGAAFFSLSGVGDIH